jgi:hypothetical protein
VDAATARRRPRLLEDRPGALVVVAEPDDELRRITAAIGEEWPSLPPHKDGRADLAYHVTVVRTPAAHLRAEATAAIAPHLPLRVRGTAFVAAFGSPESGAVHAVVATAQTS